MLLCLFISTSHAEEMSLLSYFNILLHFLLPGNGNLFLSFYLPVACLPKTILLLIMTRDSYLLLPLELQQQQAFKTMSILWSSVMTKN